MPELPRAGPPGHGGAVPRVPQARRRAHQGPKRASTATPRATTARPATSSTRVLDGDLRHFEPKGFDHKGETGFALDGLHAPLDCKACHKTRSFLGLSAACASCHKDVHNGTLGATCQTCHATSVAFKDTRKGFDHGKTKYPLTGAHATTPCESCHKTKGDYRIARFAACEDCHKNPHQPALGTCTTCHVTTSFKTLAEGQKFDHAKTGYPLRGRHATVACQTCHVKPTTLVRLKYARCADCHQDAHKGLFPAEDCAACHTEAGFAPAKFDHADAHEVSPRRQARGRRVRRLPQGGGRAGRRSARAADRRLPRREQGVRLLPRRRPQGKARLDVRDLPRDARRSSSRRSSTRGGPSSSRARTRASRARSATSRSRRPATGLVKGLAAPAGAAVQGRLLPVRGLPQGPAPRAGGPRLRAVPRPRDEGLQGRPLRPPRAKFALAGKHEAVPCARCHAKETGTFPAGTGTAVRLTGISTECRACHKDPHLGQLSPRCETCHDAASLRDREVHAPEEEGDRGLLRRQARDDRLRRVPSQGDDGLPRGPRSGRALRGPGRLRALPRGRAPRRPRTRLRVLPQRHALADRLARLPQDRRLPARGQAPRGPVRVLPRQGRPQGHAARAATTATGSASPTTASRRSSGATARPATGRSPGPPSRGTTRPRRASRSRRPTGRSTASPATRARSSRARRSDCYSCHRADYERVQNPNHVAGGFPTDCTGCHKPSAPTWQGATFTHSTFPLAGVHATQPCAACHVNNVFKGTPRDCFSCHRTDYQNSKNPPHAVAAFPTTCDSCHKFSDPNWQGAGFNHNTATTFPLVGRARHDAAVHDLPHRTATTRTVPTTCYGCHQKDATGATTPVNHAGLPTTCDSCHKNTDPTWLLATAFNHATYFPLAGRPCVTAPCAQCHTNGNFTTLQCTTTPVRGLPPDRLQRRQDARRPRRARTSRRPATRATSSPTRRGCSRRSAHTTLPARRRRTPRPRAPTCHNPPYAPSANNYTAVPTTCYGCHVRGLHGRHDAREPRRPADDVRLLPQEHRRHLASRDGLQPLDVLRARRRPRHGALRPVPQPRTPLREQLRSRAHEPVLGLPPERLQQRQDARRPHRVELPDDLRLVPQVLRRDVDARRRSATRPSRSSASTPRPRARRATTRRTPRPRTTTRPSRRPATAATSGTSPAPRRPCHHAGFPTTCDSCHKNTDATWLLATAFNHSTYFALAGAHATAPCAQCHNPPYAPPRTTTQRAHEPRARRATRPTTTTPRRRWTTSRRASRRPATRATSSPTRRGCWRRSATRPSRSSASHATTACATCHNPPYAPSANNYTTVPTTCYGCHHEGLHRRHDAREPHRPRRRRATPATRTPTPPGSSRRPSTTRRTSRSPAPTSRRPAPSATTRRTPLREQLHQRAHEPVLGVPPDRLQQRQDAGGPHRVELPDDLRLVPQVLRRDVDAGDVQPHDLPARRRRTPRPRARRATTRRTPRPRTTTRPSRRPATAVT